MWLALKITTVLSLVALIQANLFWAINLRTCWTNPRTSGAFSLIIKIHYLNEFIKILALCVKKKSKTILEVALSEVPRFKELATTLEKSFAINGKAASTLRNYLRCLTHLAIYYKASPERLNEEQINDYLFQ